MIKAMGVIAESGAKWSTQYRPFLHEIVARYSLSKACRCRPSVSMRTLNPFEMNRLIETREQWKLGEQRTFRRCIFCHPFTSEQQACNTKHGHYHKNIVHVSMLNCKTQSLTRAWYCKTQALQQHFTKAWYCKTMQNSSFTRSCPCNTKV